MVQHLDKTRILNIILGVVKEIGEENKRNRLINANSNTELYGSNGNLDSLMLVRLIADLEECIATEFGKEIIIADEKAMSQKSSPFRSIQALADYIEDLLKQNEQ